MKTLIVALALSLCYIGSAFAQATVTSGGTPITIPACPAGPPQQFLTGVVVSNIMQCGAPPAGSGTVTISQGPGISVSPNGTPSSTFTISTNNAALTVATSQNPVPASYNAAWINVDSTTPITFDMPQAGGSGYVNPWGFCFNVVNTGSLTFVAVTGSTSLFRGGPTVFNHDQSGCIYADDKNNWSIHVGTSPVVPNPNTFQ